jgi:4-hydroxy-3-methylbut-2-enyl diphosphate reductase
LVDEIVEKLRTLGADEVETMAGQQEDVKFPLPKGLWKKDLENARENQK